MTSVLEVTNGMWTWFFWPDAVYSSDYDKMFYGWVDSTGVVKAGSTDGDGNRVVTSLRTLTADDHDCPSVIVLAADGPSPGKILAVVSEHNGASWSYRSTTAGSLAAFDPAVVIDANANQVSYSSLMQMENTAKTVYHFYRHTVADVHRPHYFRTTTNGGTTWSAGTSMIDTGNKRPYVQIRKTSGSRIDVIFTNGHPNETTNSVWHFYITVAADGTRAYYRSDGTLIGDDTALPIDTTDATLVYDGSATNAWVWDLATVEGTLTAAITSFASLATVHTYKIAKFSAGTWSVETVTDGGSYVPNYLYSGEIHYSGGISLEPYNADAVFVSKAYGAGDFRVEKWAKTGASWAKESDISGNTSSVNARPRRVEDSNPTAMMYWRGTYTNYTVYNTNIYSELGAVPTNTVPPAVTGDVELGETLTASTGTWDNNPTSYAYQWQYSADGATNWLDISGSGSTFVIGAYYFRVGVVATNTAGDSAEAYSPAVGPLICITSGTVGLAVGLDLAHGVSVGWDFSRDLVFGDDRKG